MSEVLVNFFLLLLTVISPSDSVAINNLSPVVITSVATIELKLSVRLKSRLQFLSHYLK